MESKKFCAVPHTTPIVLPAGTAPGRAAFILGTYLYWVNGTRLKYYFFDDANEGSYLGNSHEWKTWKGTDAAKNVVRKAFQTWMNVGIGLRFEEVQHREDAEIRIGFMQGDGSWSYVGRDILKQPSSSRTMNFGWDITVMDPNNGLGTALHEIGHTIGLQHEHQNPNGGIVWNEEFVYDTLKGDPNYWDRQTVYDNIIKKFPPNEVKGSSWDPLSIMEYPFEPKMILKPVAYFNNGLMVPGVLSDKDMAWARQYYPPLNVDQLPQLSIAQSQPLNIANQEQEDYVFEPNETRYYQLQTFGKTDNVMVLFELDVHGNPVYLSGDDNAGKDTGSAMRLKLFRGRKYVVRVRLYYKEKNEILSLMVW